MLSIEEVIHIERLARLKLTDKEREIYRNQLNDVLNYAAKLDEIDTSNVPPMYHVLPVTNVLREDIPRNNFSLEDALNNAPLKEEGFFVIPPILGGEE
ncbi:MAG: Asp-tRNA(Asn)/Glu-tRNA(Gln) amidotransferase subunit GatC [bacterium]|nr:Asp-tRNA(Asn)/Glu-tRNA(Gln) amidotransferase subunit GatC [bacterium]